METQERPLVDRMIEAADRKVYGDNLKRYYLMAGGKAQLVPRDTVEGFIVTLIENSFDDRKTDLQNINEAIRNVEEMGNQIHRAVWGLFRLSAKVEKAEKAKENGGGRRRRRRRR